MEIIMSIFPLRLSAVTAACLLFLAGSRAAQAVVLDWNSVAWAPGSLNNSYDLNGDAVNDVTINITSQNPGIWQNDPTSGTQAPVVNQTLTGGLVGQKSLMLAANLHTNSNSTVQISFTGPNGFLANNVSFTLFDIDVTTNSDIISNIYGVAANGTHVAATITNVGSGVTLTPGGLAQVLTGNAISPDNSGNGNATISFGSAISSVFFTFGNTAGAPFYQDIAIGDVSFTPVPEINPTVTAVGSCFLAFGLTIFARRRAKLRASALGAARS